uniref:Flavin-containing monooxygenase n=1 Tax=Oryzias sinensis TaxID=183150 RepID=A0A8C7XX67_9TELE
RMLRVAVVGAGAAGLLVFEATGGVGGTWCYMEHVHEDGRPVYSSMTNLPKEVMMFPDFPFASYLSSFLSHQESTVKSGLQSVPYYKPHSPISTCSITFKHT